MATGGVEPDGRRALRCPFCLHVLVTDEPRESGGQISCEKCKRPFAVRDAIPLKPRAERSEAIRVSEKRVRLRKILKLAGTAAAILLLGGAATYYAVSPSARERVRALVEGLGWAEKPVPDHVWKLKDTDSAVRSAAADALAGIGTAAKEAMPALIEALKNKDPGVRRVAASVLGIVGPEAREAAPALIRTLKDADPTVRSLAAAALGRIGPPAKAAVPALKKASRDKDRTVRAAAALALKQIQGHAVAPSARERAIANCTKAIELKPNDAHAYLARGRAYRDEGDYERARSDFARAVALDPRGPFGRAARQALRSVEER